MNGKLSGGKKYINKNSRALKGLWGKAKSPVWRHKVQTAEEVRAARAAADRRIRDNKGYNCHFICINLPFHDTLIYWDDVRFNRNHNDMHVACAPSQIHRLPTCSDLHSLSCAVICWCQHIFQVTLVLWQTWRPPSSAPVSLNTTTNWAAAMTSLEQKEKSSSDWCHQLWGYCIKTTCSVQNRSVRLVDDINWAKPLHRCQNNGSTEPWPLTRHLC